MPVYVNLFEDTELILIDEEAVDPLAPDVVDVTSPTIAVVCLKEEDEKKTEEAEKEEKNNGNEMKEMTIGETDVQVPVDK